MGKRTINGETRPKLHEQWDGRGRPERWDLLQAVGQSTTWCESSYKNLPVSVQKALAPILEKDTAEAVALWEKGEL